MEVDEVEGRREVDELVVAATKGTS